MSGHERNELAKPGRGAFWLSVTVACSIALLFMPAVASPRRIEVLSGQFLTKS